MNFSAVLFDLDGTLLDTLDDLADAMNAVLQSRGFPPHPPASYRYFVGEGVEMLARRALPEARRDAATVAECVQAMRAQYARHWAGKTHPYSGIPGLLDGLVARGLKLAVLSNKPDDFTRLMVAHFLGRWAFAAVRGARPEVPRKPDPRAALEIAAALDVPPAKFLYLGDTGVDMQTACAAGMFPVGALWGFRAREELEADGARKLAQAPEEVLKIVDETMRQ